MTPGDNQNDPEDELLAALRGLVWALRLDRLCPCEFHDQKVTDALARVDTAEGRTP